MTGPYSPTAWPAGADVPSIASRPAIRSAFNDLENGLPALIRQTFELAAIPAPAFEEAARAAWTASRMREIGLPDVFIDDAGNVLSRLPGESPGLVLAAHMDTVFPIEDDHRPNRHDGRLYGHGIGDNTLGVTAMLEIAARVQSLPRKREVIFAATTGEEGLGDLKGVRAVIDALTEPPLVFVAIEGHMLGKVITQSVGSRRWRLEISGPGGHSWHDYGRQSAVHAAAELAYRLTKLDLPAEPRTTLNVGRIDGGEGVNIIGRRASIDIDLRSVSQVVLEERATTVLALSEEVTGKGLGLRVVKVGDRPAGSIPPNHPLVQVAVASLAEVGLGATLDSASTDANYPASLGTASVCLGVTRGGGMHTPEEWVEEKPILAGLQQLLLVTAALSGVIA